MKKPTKKREKKPPGPRPYVLQVGQVRHRDYLHRFDTEAKLKARVVKYADDLEGDFFRWNRAGLSKLNEVRELAAGIVCDRQPKTLHVVVDEHTNHALHFEFWKEDQ